MLRLWFVAALIVSAGCSRNALRARSEADLRCSDVTIVSIGAGGYAASGCGRSLSYTCVRGHCAPYDVDGDAAAAERPPPPTHADETARSFLEARAHAFLACAPAATALALDLTWAAGALHVVARGATAETNACIAGAVGDARLEEGTHDVHVLHALQRGAP